MEFQHITFLICDISLILLSVLCVNAADRYSISVSHSGSACNSSVNSNQVSESQDKVECAVGNPFDEFSIDCKPSSNLTSSLIVTWYFAKDGKNPIYEKLTPGHQPEPSGTTLKFKSLNVTDQGLYNCRIENDTAGSQIESTPQANAVLKLFVLPYVSGSRRDVTAIEGNQITLNCPVVTSVNTTVVWKVETLEINKTLRNAENRITFENLNDTVVNSALVIKSANMTLDRGNYICYAESQHGNSQKNTTFTVRVKSKYAALWPFLGICAEVVILCIIILIYEKKRDKTEQEDSDTDQGPETKSTPDHGQDNVRYRK